MAIDSRPLLGAGRVEDTFNLVGHAARKIVECAAKLTEQTYEEVCRFSRHPASSAQEHQSSTRCELERSRAARRCTRSAGSPSHVSQPLEKKELILEEPLRPYIEAIAQVQEQDIEETVDGKAHIRRGVATDRRVSIEDADMRHGRKTKTKRFNGYKEHIAGDLDTGLIVAAAVTPANMPEEEAIP